MFLTRGRLHKVFINFRLIYTKYICSIRDFSDKAIINLCDEKSFYLLTNDIDFKNSGLNIISANENYFIN